MRLIVGLGNPGEKYALTRHNLGFMVVQHLAQTLGWRCRSGSCAQGLVAQGVSRGQEILLLLPLTYMNHSGVAVKDLVQRKAVSGEEILVVCDDMNLDFGQLRLRGQGRDGGHNGLASVLIHLETETFARLRIGIGQPPDGQDAADFVLEEFSASEKQQLGEVLREAEECCLSWMTEDITKVMTQFNKRTSNG